MHVFDQARHKQTDNPTEKINKKTWNRNNFYKVTLLAEIMEHLFLLGNWVTTR